MIISITRRALTVFILTAVAATSSSFVLGQGIFAIIDTSKGEIKVKLNERAAPTTVANFTNLAQRGFYDGLIFHRYERNFMIQGGDPEGVGTGGPGYRFQGEVNLRHNQPGIISMANSGPGTDGSQFFLTHLATPHLNGLHSVFGLVSEGLPIVHQLRKGDVINSIVIEGDLTGLRKRREQRIQEWDDALDANFTGLKPVD